MFRNIVVLGDTKKVKGGLFNILTGKINDNYDSVRIGHFLFMNTFYRLFALPSYLPEYIALIKPECIIITDSAYYDYIEELKEISRVIVYSDTLLPNVQSVKSTKYSCRGINNLLCEISCVKKKKHFLRKGLAFAFGFLAVAVVCLYLLNVL